MNLLVPHLEIVDVDVGGVVLEEVDLMGGRSELMIGSRGEGAPSRRHLVGCRRREGGGQVNGLGVRGRTRSGGPRKWAVLKRAESVGADEAHLGIEGVRVGDWGVREMRTRLKVAISREEGVRGEGMSDGRREKREFWGRREGSILAKSKLELDLRIRIEVLIVERDFRRWIEVDLRSVLDGDCGGLMMLLDDW